MSEQNSGVVELSVMHRNHYKMTNPELFEATNDLQLPSPDQVAGAVNESSWRGARYYALAENVPTPAEKKGELHARDSWLNWDDPKAIIAVNSDAKQVVFLREGLNKDTVLSEFQTVKEGNASVPTSKVSVEHIQAELGLDPQAAQAQVHSRLHDLLEVGRNFQI